MYVFIQFSWKPQANPSLCQACMINIAFVNTLDHLTVTNLGKIIQMWRKSRVDRERNRIIEIALPSLAGFVQGLCKYLTVV